MAHVNNGKDHNRKQKGKRRREGEGIGMRWNGEKIGIKEVGKRARSLRGGGVCAGGKGKRQLHIQKVKKKKGG